MIFIANPCAKAGRGKTIWPFWQRELKAAGFPFTWHESASQDDAIRQARRAQTPVVAVGGDGTINNIINGLMMSGGQVPLGVLPCGARSDFCLYYEIPTEKTKALSTILQGQTRLMDLAEATMTGGHGERARCYFSCGVVLSLGAGTLANTLGWWNVFGQNTGPALGRLAAAWNHRPFKCYLTLDGEKFEFSRADHLIVFKNPYLAASLKLPGQTAEKDGRLSLLLFHDCSKIRLTRLLSLLAARQPLPGKNVFARAFSRATIINDSKLPVEFEGDPIGFTPMEVELKPGRLQLIAPVKA
ncbi:hypothetical protein C4J81_08030 [Deltaproteobacteria bacterium Smac51]|nr:hypothetical protein C4J81_08030 [Deltaproteobacteria bacterium Smac51]